MAVTDRVQGPFLKACRVLRDRIEIAEREVRNEELGSIDALRLRLSILHIVEGVGPMQDVGNELANRLAAHIPEPKQTSIFQEPVDGDTYDGPGQDDQPLLFEYPLADQPEPDPEIDLGSAEAKEHHFGDRPLGASEDAPEEGPGESDHVGRWVAVEISKP